MKIEEMALLLTFMTPVIIVITVCGYKLLNKIIENRHPRLKKRVAEPNPFAGETIEELRERAANMQRRIQTLEEILAAEQLERGN